MGCDIDRLITNTLQKRFQSTHPHGVRRNLVRVFEKTFSFNPRTHMGCDRYKQRSKTASDGFNPRTHMGCDLSDSTIKDIRQCFNPRTHMGCDDYINKPHSPSIVSIHAPTWGATVYSNRFYRSPQVSIHAPTWGATLALLLRLLSVISFNPRTHMGCDIG